MPAATLDHLWHRIQEISFYDPYARGQKSEPDTATLDYLTEQIQTWKHLTRRWQEALELPKESYFTLAQDTAVASGAPELPQEIGEWLGSWYKDPPMNWRGFSHALALIEGALLWKLCEEQNLLGKRELGDPYEPTLEFFEWGGWIYHEHGLITTFYPTRMSLMLNARLRGSLYDPGYREYLESQTKLKKKKHRSATEPRGEV